MPKPCLIVAHRGASLDAPENTLAAFVLAWMQGADAIEGDFRLTKDGHVVCIHDEETGRTTNRALSVHKSTLSALKELDAGSWYSPQWKKQSIPTLEEVLDSLPPGKLLFADLKSDRRILKPIARILSHARDRQKQVVLMSFDPAIVGETREVFPDNKVLWLVNRRRQLVSTPWTPSREEIMEVLDATKADGLNCNAPGIGYDHKLADRVLKAGKELHTWTVNRGSNAKKLLELGVQSITTDRPGWLRSKL